MTSPDPVRRGRRWYRHPSHPDREALPVEFPAVRFYGPFFDRHDIWLGVFWVHSVQGWDGGWWEGWRFYVVLVPTVVLRMDVDRSGYATRAFRRWVREVGYNPRPAYRRWPPLREVAR
jgi:hypothetical protein